MKITLIEPKSPDSHIFSLYALPRLGTILLGTILRDEGHDVCVMVESIEEIGWDTVLGSDLVGISTTTSTAPRAYEMAAAVKYLGIPTVLGGPHVTFMSDEGLRFADYVIRGEAERSFPLFIDVLAQGGDMGSVPGLSYVRGGKVVNNPIDGSFIDLNDLPEPDISLIAGDMLKKRKWVKRVIPIQTSRGCPYNCTFCSVTRMFGRRMRYRDVDAVIEDIRKYDDKKNSIFFYDDNFAADPRRTKELLRKMIAEGFSFVSSAQVRVDAGKDHELVGLMREAGLKTVFVGLESTNTESLSCMNKKQTMDDMEEGLSGFAKFGIDVHGMFILGFDTDTKKSLRDTVTFAKRHLLDSVQFLVLTPMPGTPVYNNLVKDGRIIIKDWSFYDGHHVVFTPKLVSPYQLQKAQIRGHLRFYSIREVIRRLNNFDFFGVMLTAYAKRLSRSWVRENRIYLKAMKLIQSTEDYIVSIDLKRTTGDVKKAVSDAIARAAGTIREIGKSDTLGHAAPKGGERGISD
jgi:anaerobic magnesium-protoporphyrin IX monomethyl ester cyclase